MSSASLTFGVTRDFPCSYLKDQQEKLLIAVDERLHNTPNYGWLMANGFRRSGDQLYRPNCDSCNACQSIRVIAGEFKPSKSQKRLTNKNSDLVVKIEHNFCDNYFPLFEHYINTLHTDGSMYPASREQFYSFLACNLSPQVFVEIWQEDTLLSVAVTDVLPNALSAVYTFYHPEYRKRSLGMYSILQQINLSKTLDKPYLYLGYQIDTCQKMNYKTKFTPYQRFIENNWQTVK
ncbi:arginyltransferase [Thalassotalea sp. LPB0316]|uniref:arginyltransferase n=1 Tax=Thalassotalea sp. LPB0316 TaxID=2769490 RepID=UPI001868BAE3|nr:arginyltransferase [Thalassotalea sp. LPB0316]QOL25030.1 arginyltransferase [Thalassotalea sp. LPB0316]